MEKLGFGACLADDMGLEKTLQVLTFLAWFYKSNKKARVLLVVPASLLGNWKKEAERFTPDLPVLIPHGKSANALDELYKTSSAFLNITTYGMALRMTCFQEERFDYLILDEAQAIKNPVAKQTRAIKKISAGHKIAMTGTPIENDLSNLWSLFDFLNKGPLGSSTEFRALAKKQVVLYRKQVDELERTLNSVKGMERRGLILAYITRLKQICNRPDQFLGQATFDPKESGKFEALRTICETISTAGGIRQ